MQSTTLVVVLLLALALALVLVLVLLLPVILVVVLLLLVVSMVASLATVTVALGPPATPRWIFAGILPWFELSLVPFLLLPPHHFGPKEVHGGSIPADRY